MKLITGLILVIAILASAVRAEDVQTLTAANFDSVIAENEAVLVEFYAPWCGHCKKLAPLYEQAATALLGTAVLAKVDATEEKDLGERFEIQSYPTLKWFKKGEYRFDYDGERTAAGIEEWVRRRIEPPVVEISDKAAFEAFNARPTQARVILFEAEDGEDVTEFTEAADSVEGADFSFGRIRSAELAKELDQKLDTVVFFYDHQPPIVYTDPINDESLREFLKTKAYPRLETLVLNQAFINRVTTAQRPVVMAFHENADQLEIIREFANKNHEKAQFAEASTTAYPDLAARWGASGTKYPTFVLAVWIDGTPTFKAFDEELELTVENAEKFLDDCLDADSCVGNRKSEPIPEDKDKSDESQTDRFVKRLVYKNFDSVVLDPTKDVLVEFYAPWCGHCKALEPTYNQLAEAYQNHDHLVIAKIDATANYVDSKYNIQGFPTLMYFKADDKENPVGYEGNRDLATMVNWIMSVSTQPIDDDKLVKVSPHVIEDHDEL